MLFGDLIEDKAEFRFARIAHGKLLVLPGRTVRLLKPQSILILPDQDWVRRGARALKAVQNGWVRGNHVLSSSLVPLNGTQPKNPNTPRAVGGRFVHRHVYRVGGTQDEPTCQRLSWNPKTGAYHKNGPCPDAANGHVCKHVIAAWLAAASDRAVAFPEELYGEFGTAMGYAQRYGNVGRTVRPSVPAPRRKWLQARISEYLQSRDGQPLEPVPAMQIPQVLPHAYKDVVITVFCGTEYRNRHFRGERSGLWEIQKGLAPEFHCAPQFRIDRIVDAKNGEVLYTDPRFQESALPVPSIRL
jgi:hypothetical protein